MATNRDALYSRDSAGAVTGLVGPGGLPIPLATSLVPAYTQAVLPIYRAKLAKVRAGVTSGTNGINGQLKIGVLGDSTTTGFGCGTGGTNNITNARQYTPGVQLAKRFAAAGIPAISDTFMGDQGVYTIDGNLSGYQSYDPRIALTGTSGIYPNGNWRSMGGIYFQLKATGDTMTFTPGNAWDTAVIYYENGAVGTALMSLGNVGVITGGATVTTTNAGPASFGKQTITITKAATPLIFTQTSGAPVIRGVWCYDSTTPRVSIFNLGFSGAIFSNEGLGYGPAITNDAYDLIILNMTINDITNYGADGITGFKNALNLFISQCATQGTDLVLVTPNAVNHANYSAYSTYAATLRAAASTNGLPFIDNNTRLGTWSALTSAGEMYDNLHPNSAGIQDLVTGYANYLLTV